VSQIRFNEDGTIEGRGIRRIANGVETELPGGSNIFSLLDVAGGPFILSDEKLRCGFFPSNLVPESSDEERIDLLGLWKVKKWPFNVAEEELIRSPGQQDGWEEVIMPGAVHLRDADTPPPEDYDLVRFSHLDPEDGALLYRQLDVPSDLCMEGKIARLRFDGLYPRGAVHFNGQQVGVVETGLTPVEFELTPYVSPGETLDIVIRLWRKGPYSRLDMPRWTLDYTGIHRAAYIKLVPEIHVNRLRIEQTLSDDMKDGILRVHARIVNKSSDTAEVSLDAELPGAEGEMSGSGTIEAGADGTIELEARVPDVEAWSDEGPHLYDLSMWLRKATDGSALQTFRRRVGFRRFEIRNQRPLLNGRPLKVRGINFLSFVPERGLAISREEMRRELELMRRANINGIRTHLSGSAELVSLCDELGMFLIQELPIDWAPDYVRDPEKLGGILLRLQGAVSRDRNHPSVLLWAVGNENLVHEEKNREIFLRHSRLFDRYIKTLDPTRYTMFPPPGPTSRFPGLLSVELGEIADIHYTFKPIRQLNETGKLEYPTSWEGRTQCRTREQLLEGQWTGVWFSSEYMTVDSLSDLHEAGYLSYIDDGDPWRDAGKRDMVTTFRERLQREWGYMEADPTCLGGAYFNWKDPAVGQEKGWVQYGEHGTWGIVSPWLSIRPVWWLVRTIFAPVKVPQEVVVEEPREAVSLEVDNHMSFTNLRGCKIYARVCPGSGRSWGYEPSRWHVLHPDVPPNSKGTITVPLGGQEESFRNGAPVVIRLTFVDPRGYCIVTTDTQARPLGASKPSEEEDISLMGQVGGK